MVIFSPSHNKGERFSAIEGLAGSGFTMTFTGSESGEEQPKLSTALTRYSPDDFIDIVASVTPLDQMLLTGELDLRLTAPPSQKVSAPVTEILGLSGNGEVTTLTAIFAEVASQP
jgi:hypothetical protein